jgi:hypothetical protein
MLKNLFSIRAVRAAAAFAIIATAGGCGGDDDNNTTGIPGVGTQFTATLTGGSAGTYTGFANSVLAGGSFSIGLSSTDGRFVLAFTRVGGRPATGTYTLGTNPQTGFAGALNVNTGQFVYSSTNGTLTITASSSTEIKGTFSFSGPATAGGGAATSATGSFTSTCTGC